MNIHGYSWARLIWLLDIISIPKFGHIFVQHIHATLVFEFCRGAKTNETHFTTRWSFQERDKIVAKWHQDVRIVELLLLCNDWLLYLAVNLTLSSKLLEGWRAHQPPVGNLRRFRFFKASFGCGHACEMAQGLAVMGENPTFWTVFHMKMMKQSTTTF